MRKIVSLILIVSMVFASLAAALVTSSCAATSDGVHGYQPCDANDDGRIDMKDVLAVRKYMAKIIGKRDINFLAADVNVDSLVNAHDLLYIRKVILSIITDVAKNNSDAKYKVSLLKIGSANISRFDILIPSDADKCVTYSADLLKNYIRRACGITLNILKDRSAAKGHVIEFRLDPDNEYDLGLEGYNVKVDESGDMIFTCGEKRGALYVVYYFLENCVGYRFLNDDIVYLYEADEIDTPIGYNETEVPFFSYRGLNQLGSTDSGFASLRLNAVDARGSGRAANPKYGGGVGNLYIHGHSYAYQEIVGRVMDEEGVEDWDSDEAMEIFEEYAYSNAKIDERGYFNTQPCLTSEDTFRWIMNFNRLLYKERTTLRHNTPGVEYTMISVSPNDNTKFCTCTNCKAVYSREGSIAGAVFAMSNKASDAMAEEMPGVGVFTIAYWDARNPPKYTRPNDNVCVCFCVGGCNNHTYDDVQACIDAGGNPRYPFKIWDLNAQADVFADFNMSNEYDINCFDKWCELTNNVYFWYYASEFYAYIAPSPNIFNIYEDFRYIAERGATGMYTEGSSRGYSFELLRGYLASRMMWDPLMSEEEFEGYLDEFLMIYFGDGWRNLKAYLKLQTEAGDRKGCWVNNFDWPWDEYDKTYFGEKYAEMRDLFDAAYNEAATQEQKDRVAMCSVHCHFLGLSATYESDYVNGSSAAKAEYTRRYTWLWNYFRDHGYISGSREDGYIAADFISNDYGLTNFPSSASNVYDTMRWLYSDYDGKR